MSPNDCEQRRIFLISIIYCKPFFSLINIEIMKIRTAYTVLFELYLNEK